MTRAVNPYVTKLDKNNAYWMAKLAKLAYIRKSKDDETPDEVKILNTLKSEDSDFISVFGINNNSAQGIIVEHTNYLAIAFRGTDEIADWLDNLNAFSLDRFFGSFHRGFFASFEDVWQPLFSEYMRLRAIKKRPLFLSGHSLGGAMASIAAAQLIHEDLPFSSVYTFGQPRAMNRATSRIFNAECKNRYFRFHNNNDIITRVPARAMGYSHVGSYLYISQEKVINRESGFWYRFVDHVDGFIDSIGKKGLDGVEDHSIDDYLSAVAAWDID